MMTSKTEKRIQVNLWLTKARVYYSLGIIFIGLVRRLTSNFSFSSKAMVIILLIVLIFDVLGYFVLLLGRKLQSEKLILFLSIWQIIFELLAFTFLFYYAGGLEGLVGLSFFLPIISAGFFFGFRGSVLVALISSTLMLSVTTMEFLGVIPHLFRFGVRTIQYTDYRMAISYLFSYAIYFIIVGVYFGHMASLLNKREAMLSEKSSSLEQESKYRKNEWKQLDKTAKLLVKRDRELLHANEELDKKVKELQQSEVAMLKAFSDLKDGKVALELEKNKTSAIVENIIDPIIVVNNDDKIELLNQSARDVLNFNENYNKKKIDTKNNFSMKNFQSITETDYEVSTIPEEEGGKDEEELVIEIEGQEITYKVITAKVIDVNRENLGTMKIFYNLTREKMLDKLKSEFITIAAHQLRTPLSAIKWVIKMVLDGDAGALNTEQASLLKKGYKSNERIIALVNDMLNVSRIEEGRFGYKMLKGDLSKIVDSILEDLSGNLEKKSIKLTFDKDSDFPLLNFDAKKMTLVMQNLIENAIKYSPEHGKINIKMRRDGKFVKVVIKDNGIGIPEADKGKLFSKFYRAENALRLQTEGSGLGLFIVKNIVKKHGGDISVESEEGVGSKFIITLPIEFKLVEDI